MIGFTDVAGVPLSGGANYRVNLPANIPAGNFWSLTLYEAENASGLANSEPFPSLGSRDKPVQNADRSRTSISGRKRPRARTATGSPQCPAKGTSRSWASTPRPKPPSTRVGRLATSKRPIRGTVMWRSSPAYAKTIGRMAYVWGWPLVNMINRSPPASSLKNPRCDHCAGASFVMVSLLPPEGLPMLFRTRER